LGDAIEKVKSFNPEILFTVLGMDTYEKDPLADIKLEKKSYGKIASELTAFTQGKYAVPMVILFAGGYSKDLPKLWWEFVENL
jgi:acetoin utilization deacetylase AcuC-like enzyme